MNPESSFSYIADDRFVDYTFQGESSILVHAEISSAARTAATRTESSETDALRASLAFLTCIRARFIRGRCGLRRSTTRIGTFTTHALLTGGCNGWHDHSTERFR